MPKTITITGDSIPLPKRLAKKWQGRRVEISDAGFIVVALDETRRERRAQEALAWLQSLPKGLMRPSEIQREIEAYRREQRNQPSM